MFNPNQPHGTISGSGAAGARFYQGGHYYGGDHRYLFSDPGVAPPPGFEIATSLDDAIRTIGPEGNNRIAEPPTDNDPPPDLSDPPEPSEPPQGLSREQQLYQLNVPQLQQLQLVTLAAMEEAKPEGERVDRITLKNKHMIKGAGAKEKLVAWLLENTIE